MSAEQNRERASGRFSFDGQHERVCVCGHALGIHAAEAPHPCFNEDSGLEGATGEACACERFRLPRVPLRKVIRLRDGQVMRRTRAGEAYKYSGYEELLECGHVFVPFDNHRMGGQDEPHDVGQRRRCEQCAAAKETKT